MHDAVELEKRGIASTVLVTTPFDSQSRAMATILGVPGYEYAIIDHPMGSLKSEEVMGRAKVAAPQVIKQLTI